MNAIQKAKYNELKKHYGKNLRDKVEKSSDGSVTLLVRVGTIGMWITIKPDGRLIR